MADFTKTITNSLSLFGVAPSDKWAVYSWSSFIWGEGTEDLETRFTKNLTSETITLTDSYDISAQYNIILAESLDFTSILAPQELSDGSGYFYVYPDNVIEAEDRYSPSYTSLSANTQTWVSASLSSITWS